MACLGGPAVAGYCAGDRYGALCNACPAWRYPVRGSSDCATCSEYLLSTLVIGAAAVFGFIALAEAVLCRWVRVWTWLGRAAAMASRVGLVAKLKLLVRAVPPSPLLSTHAPGW